MCEGSGECRLAGSMMAISAVCFECNLPSGSAGTQCVLGLLLIVWRSTRFQNSQHTEEVTQPDLTRFSRVYWISLRPLRTQQAGPDGTRLSRAVHHCFSFYKSYYCVAAHYVLQQWAGFAWALACVSRCFSHSTAGLRLKNKARFIDSFS